MATPWDENPAVVLDNGSGVVKSGFAGDEAPRSVFPTVIGRARNAAPGAPPLVGDEALKSTERLTITYPLEHGIVHDWDDMERIWRQCYRDLGVDPANQALLATEAPMNPKANREKMLQVFFESMNVPAAHIQIQAVLALYSNGRTEGLVVDSGDGVSHIVPIYESRTIPSAIRRLDLAGRDLTEWMMELLNDETERPFTTSKDREIARSLKEEKDLCYVAQDFQEEMDKTEDAEACKGIAKEVTLPDGQKVTLARSRFCCPELLFQPAIADKTCQPIHMAVKSAVEECPIDIRRALLNNILLSGGSTMFPGMEQRMTKEVRALVPQRSQDDVRVIAPGERKYSIWMGGAILSSLTSFGQEWITRQEYDEVGPSIVHKRCDAFAYVEK